MLTPRRSLGIAVTMPLAMCVQILDQSPLDQIVLDQSRFGPLDQSRIDQKLPERKAYPTTRSAWATIDLALSCAMIAVRCLRSYTPRSMITEVKSGDSRLIRMLSML